YRLLKVGDDLTDAESIAIDLWEYRRSNPGGYDRSLLFNTNNGNIDVFMVDNTNFGFGDKNCDVNIRWDQEDCDHIVTGSVAHYTHGSYTSAGITANSPYYYIDLQELAVYYDLTFGNTVTAVGSIPVYVKLVSKALPTAPTKTGYTFTGWYTDEACTNKYTASTVTSDIVLYAGFKANTYSIKFNANSGSGTMDNLSMTYDQAKNLTKNTFTKEHYAFKGWATSANGAVEYGDGASVKNLASANGATVELFAVWERSEVKVDFVSESKTTTTWVTIGSNATLPLRPVKEGYTFVGWYFADGTKYTNQNLSADTTLTARFEIIKCTVTFIVDGEVYCVYVCDWGTSLAEALNANDVNLALMSVEDEYRQNF
ncbi:MAG: InlB B-repeat-containing protein, partial [Firmicutes bacterium]|nr:InlB B-repeat-containing protein [Bacillota bacterium]